MENNLNIIGNKNSVIYYNLNKHFTNLKKIIITKEIILNSFESSDVFNLFERLKSMNPKEYMDLIEQSKRDGVFEIKIKNELYSKLNEFLPKLSETLMDVHIQNYNFMNSVNNNNLTVTLRTENYSISKYFLEKGNILNNIRLLIEEYLFNGFNSLNLNKIDEFQIEIYESEEINKRIFLRKEGNNLLLYSSFGFPYNKPFDHDIGGEFYYSINDDFTFYKNKQFTALIREHGKIIEKEINKQENVLSNDELILINELTKNIDDALIELYFNKKGNLRILNLSLEETNYYSKSEDGFIIFKSSKNYDKISTITMRDDIQEETPNPKYLMIKNLNEIKELVSNLSILEFIDGVILNINFYSPVFDYIFRKFDIDLIYFEKTIPKLLELSIDLENFNINIEDLNKEQNNNPFNNIIKSNNKEKDDLLNKLKNIDLSTPNEVKNNNSNIEEINNIANSLMSSSNSSINKSGNYSSNNSLNSNSKKKSAIDFLVDVAMQGPGGQNKIKNSNDLNNNINTKSNNFDNTDTNSNINNDSNTNNSNFNNNNFRNETENIGTNNGLNNGINDNSNNNNNKNNNYANLNNNDNNYHNNDNDNNSYNKRNYNMNNITSENSVEEIYNNFNKFENNRDNINNVDYKNNVNNNINKNNDNYNYNNNSNLLDKYENILGVEILTSPNINSNSYFVDVNSLGLINNLDETSNIYCLVDRIEHFNINGNNNLKFISTIDLFQNNYNENRINKLIINSSEDLFRLNYKELKKNEIEIFLNLSKMDDSIKENILEYIFSKLDLLSIILLKDDLYLIENYINRINSIMIRDLTSIEDLEFVKNKILSFEKRFLIKKYIQN